MTVLHRISEDFRSDVCILDGTGTPMTDFNIQAILTLRYRFHVGRNKGNRKYKRSKFFGRSKSEKPGYPLLTILIS
jgi:hypothetical protein